MLETSKYVVAPDAEKGGYVVHTNWCEKAPEPASPDEIFLGHFANCFDAVDRARALDIEAHACILCCKECQVL